MKILFISTLYYPNIVGGAERVLQSLAEALLAAGYEPVVVSIAPESGTRVDHVNGVKVYYVGLKNLYWPFRREGRPGALKPLWHAIDTSNPLMTREVIRILEEERPDLVHTHTLTGFSTRVWPEIKRRKLPIVHTLHEYYLLCPNGKMYRDGSNCAVQHWDCRLFSLPRVRASRIVDAVVSVSRFVLERHLSYGAFAGVPEQHVIYNMYRPQEQSRPRTDRGDGRPFRFGFMGQLDPIKGIEVLLEVAKQIPDGGWELLIAGKGVPAYVDDLHKRYAIPAVRFLGFTKPEEFFSQIDVLIVPSLWHEPFGMVTLEALSYGLPVIGSNTGATPEIIDHARTGLLFDPDDPDELRDALETFLRSPSLAHEMGPHCLEKAKTFEPERIIPQYEAIYTAVTSPRRIRT